MIDLNYKNHSFKQSEGLETYFYVCINCNAKMWYYDKYNRYNFYSCYDENFKLTCEEWIIKSIIE